MTLPEQLQSDLVAAMKAVDAKRRDALRSVKTAIKNEEVAVSHPLNDDETLTVIARLIKQLDQAATEYRQLGEEARANDESSRAEFLRTYLPAPLSDDELHSLIKVAIAEANASSPADMGAVMKLVKPQVGTRADGARVAELVRAALANWT